MAKRFRLGKPELAGELEKLSRQAKLPREVERLRAVRMAMSGDFTLEQIALACGRALALRSGATDARGARTRSGGADGAASGARAVQRDPGQGEK
jgi:hypothetical protein